MDAAFIQQHMIIERYLMGRLPLKGAQDFERYCREHPDTIAQLGLPDRINAALRLVDAAGEPQPWAERPQAFYQKPWWFAGAAAAAVLLLVATIWLATTVQRRNGDISGLKTALHLQPLLPVQATRSIVIEPSRYGPVGSSAVRIGAGQTELADFKYLVAWSKFSNFRVTFDRVGHGRVAVVTNLMRDSNGHLRVALNSSALGPGDYEVTIEGMDWRGGATPEAWTRFSVER
ncbi:MAG: hypothetical protein ABW278_00330 [Steroidobacteraceae bacterium]